MTKLIGETVYSAALGKIQSAVQVHLCDTAPSSYGQVNSYSCGFSAVTSADFTLINSTSQRRLALSSLTNISITDTTTLTHIAFVDSTDLLAVTEHSIIAVYSGTTRNLEAVYFEMSGVI